MCHHDSNSDAIAGGNFPHSNIKIWKANTSNVLEGGGTKKLMLETKSTKYIFYQISSPSERKIQNLFLNRALIPQDYNTGLQIRDFWCAFS